MSRALLIVAKRPAAGHTKTRLCPPLSGRQAAALYEGFLRDTLDVARRAPGARLSIAYLAESEAEEQEARAYFHALAPDMALTPQRGSGLGERLHHLLSEALRDGARCAVVMDSDSPTLPPACLAQAFERLDDGCDVVLGPCDDGGYYLIGLTRPQPRLLCEVRMSTPTVLADTLAIATQLQLRVGLLDAWYDVDTAVELERLRAELAAGPAGIAPHTRACLREFDAAGRLAHARVAHHPGAE
jgi:rSAM/selenodomain-associated transferase 1